MHKRGVSLKRKKVAGVFLTLAVTLAMFLGTVHVSAAPAEEYTYTVRILPGAKGTITSGNASQNGVSPTVSNGALVYTGLKKGDRITFNKGGVSVKNSDKYRANQIRKSGLDNNYQAQNIKVTEDADYVVSYSVRKANEMTFTIHYVYA